MATSKLGTAIPRSHRTLFVLAAVMTWVLVSSGGFVCVMDASSGCPDWPTCHGRLIPPLKLLPLVEWAHRIASPITLPVIIAAAVVAWRKHRQRAWVLWPSIGAIAAILNVVLYGAIGVFWGLSRGWAAADLGTALLSLASIVVAAVAVARAHSEPCASLRPSLEQPVARLGLVATGALFATLVSGVLVAREHSVVRCLGWPDMLAFDTGDDLLGRLQLARVGLAALTVVLVALTAWRAWRVPALRVGAAVIGSLLAAAVALGALVTAPDPGFAMPTLTMLAAGGLWSVLVAVTTRAAVESG